MAEIVNLIQEEQLFGVHWDTQPIGKVLKEILTLFQDQFKRISKLEKQVPLFAEKSALENLNNNILDLENKSSEQFERIKKENKVNQEKLTKEIESLKDYIDNANLSVVSESRRLVTNEISNYVPKVYETDPIIIKLNEALKENVNSIKKLQNDFDSITIPPSSPNSKPTLDRSAVRVIQCEKKISELESMMQNYPSLESDVLNMQLQLPNSLQKLERKIDDIQTALENKINLKITPSQNVKETINTNSSQNSLPSTPKRPLSNGGSTVSSFVKVDNNKMDPPIEPVFDTSFLQQAKKIEMPELLPDLRPNPLLEKIKLDEEERKKRKQEEMIDLIKSIPSNSHAQPSFKDESFEIEKLPNDQVVKIYETHTHVSELQSSVRVVSELEWCTQAINQHHDAIRQLQQGLRTQQDNFDTITENLMRVNSTNNTRISQLAQQNLHQNQDIDELRRQFCEQLNKLQVHIYKLQQKLDDPNFDLSNLKKDDENDMKSEVGISPSNSLLKKKAVLPPLSNSKLISGGKSSDSLLSSNDDQDDKNKEDSENKKNLAEKDESKDDKENPPKKAHNFTIYTTHFIVNAPKWKAHTIFSTIGPDPPIIDADPNEKKGKNDSRNRIDHIDLYDSLSNTNLLKPQNIPGGTRLKNDHNRNITSLNFSNCSNGFNGNGNNGANDDDEFFSSKPIDSSKYSKSPIVYKEGIINLMRPYSSRQDMIYPSGLEALGLSDAEITEMIEDKVSMVARKTIAILADHAKEKMNEQAKEVKKSIDQVISLVDGKIDRDFVERMFNKFRVMINEMNEKIENLQCSFLEWVTRDELEMVLQKFVSIVTDVKDAAATKAKYNCLLCGRPRQHLAGMMIGNVIQKNSQDENAAASSGSIAAGQTRQKLPRTVPPTAMKPTRKISTGFQPDEVNDRRKRTQTALGTQHHQQQQQVPRDVVQFLTTS